MKEVTNYLHQISMANLDIKRS